MGIADLMNEIRKLPDDELLALAAQVEAEAARAVDTRFTAMVKEGDFDQDGTVGGGDVTRKQKLLQNLRLRVDLHSSLRYRAPWLACPM